MRIRPLCHLSGDPTGISQAAPVAWLRDQIERKAGARVKGFIQRDAASAGLMLNVGPPLVGGPSSQMNCGPATKRRPYKPFVDRRHHS